MEIFKIFSPIDGDEIPLLTTIVHSGSEIPDDISPQFNPRHSESLINTDWHLEKLFGFIIAQRFYHKP